MDRGRLVVSTITISRSSLERPTIEHLNSELSTHISMFIVYQSDGGDYLAIECSRDGGDCDDW